MRGTRKQCKLAWNAGERDRSVGSIWENKEHGDALWDCIESSGHYFVLLQREGGLMMGEGQ